MGKLIFAVVVFVLGVAIYNVLRRPGFLPPALAAIVPRLLLAVSIGIPALIVIFSVFRIIPAGHVGVKVLFGQVEPQPLREGLNVVLNPLYDVVDMDVRVVKHTARYDAASKDLQAVHVEMVLNYRVMPDRAPEVYRNIGPNFSSVIIDPAAQEVLKANTATHNAEEILLARPRGWPSTASTRRRPLRSGLRQGGRGQAGSNTSHAGTAGCRSTASAATPSPSSRSPARRPAARTRRPLAGPPPAMDNWSPNQ